MKRLGWLVERRHFGKVFIKKFPFLGSFIKILRVGRFPNETDINEIIKKYRPFRVIIELDKNSAVMPFTASEINNAINRAIVFAVNKNPYTPTKTIQIDLTPDEKEIFSRFSEAKRRAVRKAQKNKVQSRTAKSYEAVEQFSRLKRKQMGIFGWLLGGDIKALWESFSPKSAVLLLAFSRGLAASDAARPLAGILMLFHNKTAYYWSASSTKEGSKISAPALLVWEALKLAKKQRCRIFDFEGVRDERYPNLNKNWQGFTRFKQGFGGREIYYPGSFIWKKFPVI